MKIFITGATGLIGANSALELLQAGHQVRLLVRNKTAAEQYFAQHGYQLDDFVVADMLDKAAVKQGMQGCDAVLHCAAIVDLDPRHAEKTIQTNLQSIEAVIGSACELGIKKILYVSSMSIFYDFKQSLLTEATPLVEVQDAYSRSKKLSEEKVRALQAEGQPIIITYPSMVLGPNDPKLAESNSSIIRFVTQVMPITSSGTQPIDARDVALAHRLLLESTLNANSCEERYILGGIYNSWPDFADAIETAAGQKLRRMAISGKLFRALGHIFDALRKLIPISFPISKEAMRIVTQLPPASSDKLINKTGISFRPTQQTIHDTVTWMRETGRL
ncbi:MAG: SDR family NAD(P)-dependent oxidoreductase [Pseudomonadales bacterium]|nr:SDR family NAD(P)-dependent oxidoreductase [Pseudomonadales bacterium]